VADNEIDTLLEATVNTIKAGVPELNVYPRVVPSIVLPALMAYPPDEVGYAETFDDEATVLFVLRLYVQQQQNGNDQKALNRYISRDGDKSVVKVLRDNPRVGGAAADVRVVQAANYGNWPVGSVTYLGVELRISAMLP
jgi:hypothetical protein